MRGYVQKKLYPEPLNLYFPVVQWATVRLVLILQCIIVFHSQSIDFVNAFSWADIPSGEPVSIELPRYFKSYVRQCDVVIRLNKSLYCQAKATRLWYETLWNSLLYFSFLVSEVDPCMFVSKTVVCVVYVDDCLFWSRSKYDIYNLMKFFKEYGPSYNWGH